MDIIKGLIDLRDDASDYDGLYIDDEPLSQRMEKYTDSFITVRFFISDTDNSIEELRHNLILSVAGSCNADYGPHYSELTGYLWTDDDLSIGEHNIIDIISNYDGKYLYMEIEKH